MPNPYSTSSAFFNSIGVNTHLNYYPAYENVDLLVSILCSLGIKHVRDGFHTSVTNQAIPNYDPDSVLYSAWNALGRTGVRFNVVVDPNEILTINKAPLTAAILNQLTLEAGMFVESFEGANEMDNGTPPGWPQADIAWQKSLYAAVKSMAQAWQPNYFPVLGPSLANAQQGTNLGNLSQWLDYGNLHPYPGGQMPSVIFPSQLQFAKVVSGSKPIMATESGYYTATNVYGGVSELAAAKYILRLLLLNFMKGIERTYLYELMDDSAQTTPENVFGLVRADGSAKPAFFALKNLIGLLPERSSPPLAPLVYTLSGPPVSSLLLQQSDSTWLLFLWQEVSCFNLTTKTDVTNPAVPVALTLADAMYTETYEPLLQRTPLNISSATNLTLSVNDHPTVLKIGKGL